MPPPDNLLRRSLHRRISLSLPPSPSPSLYCSLSPSPSKGVFGKTPDRSSLAMSAIFRLLHGGDVEADGNCLFTAATKAMGSKVGARELMKLMVARFLADLGSGGMERDQIDKTMQHLYSPDLKAGWGYMWCRR